MREIESLEELYRETVLDHYRSPRNSEPLEQADAKGEAVNPFCGDEVRIQLASAPCADGRAPAIRVIEGVFVSGLGCSISQASASLMGEAVKGKTVEQALALAEKFRAMMNGNEQAGSGLGDLAALEGVRRYPVRIKCALLGWSALADALAELAGA